MGLDVVISRVYGHENVRNLCLDSLRGRRNNNGRGRNYNALAPLSVPNCPGWDAANKA